MGLGYWLSEQLIYDKASGELLTDRTLNYWTPGPKDIPIDFRTTFWERLSNPTGIHTDQRKPVNQLFVCPTQ